MENSEAALEAEVDIDQREQARKGNDERARTAKSNTRISTDNHGDEADESSPLLPSTNDDDEQEESWSGGEDFAHLPWWKRPSIFYVLGPFFLMALAFGGVITPKVNLILELVCKQYIDEQSASMPGFTMAPVDFVGGNNDQCRIPEVQAKVARFTLMISLIAGLLSAVTSPILGSLSDRYGRKPILVITSAGTIAGEIITIMAATNPEKFTVEWLLLGSALDGLTGSFIVAMAIANSYAADCTPPSQRNVAFGYFHAALFGGIAVGPIIAGYIVKFTGRIVVVFYILAAVHVFFALFIGLIAPESLSKKRQLAAREVREKEQRESEKGFAANLRSLNILAPLKILYPTGEGSSPALRRNLIFLAAVDTIVFGVAMGSMMVVLIYTNYEFGWRTFEQSKFMSIVNSSRVVALMVGLPLLTRLVRGKPGAYKQKTSGSDLYDLSVIRLAIFIDTMGYLGYTLARSGPMMILSGSVAAIGGIGSPTLQSALTKHVPADRTGQLLGATGLLHALARVVAPTLFNAIYAATVGKFTQTVFVCLASTFGLAFILSWFIAPGVYLHEPSAEEESTDL